MCARTGKYKVKNSVKCARIDTKSDFEGRKFAYVVKKVYFCSIIEQREQATGDIDLFEGQRSVGSYLLVAGERNRINYQTTGGQPIGNRE